MTFTKFFEKFDHIIGKDDITGKWLVDDEIEFAKVWRSFTDYAAAINWAQNN